MGYDDRPQSVERIERKRRVLEYFDTHGGTIGEIAAATGVSRSSVQRFLNEFDDVDTLRVVKDYLKNNQNEGRSIGGKHSGYSKDEAGKFTGSRKK